MRLFALILIVLIILLAALSVVGCFFKKRWLLSRPSKFWQIIGGFCSNPCMLFVTIVLFIVTILSWCPDLLPTECVNNNICKVLSLVTLSALLILLIQSAGTLSTIFTLRKEDIWITRSQIAILIYTILLIAVIFVFFGSEIDSFIPVTCIGSVLGWIFQDSIKGAATFVKFRLKGMLNIGDWIKLDKSGVDGKIKSITLTTIYMENWDSTTSSVPMSALYSEQLKNLQKMNEGKTNGRRMLKEFILDSSWIHPLSNEEIVKIKSILGEDNPYVLEQVHEGRQNIQVFREYLNYYLHCHPRVSYEPRLMVRWMEHIQEGVVLQVYAFLMDTTHMGFEKTQSVIFEHIIESMAWFGLQLYQTPSSYDSKSSIIYLANKDEKN